MKLEITKHKRTNGVIIYALEKNGMPVVQSTNINDILERENKELKKQIEKLQAENNNLLGSVECFANGYGYDIKEII
tara:strand:+ start:2545 stop:2775 length:231 start_codon:yes stop_codon:yes gene_type:complete